MHHQSFYQIFKNEWLSFGRKHTKKDFFFFLWAFALVFVGNFIVNFVVEILTMTVDSISITALVLLNIVATALSLIFAFGIVKVFIMYVRDQRKRIADLWDHDRKRFLWWMVTRLLVTVLIMLWLVLLIIPWIYVAVRLYFADYFVIDQKMNAIEAVSASREVTKWHFRELVGVGLLSFGVILIGTLALFIGLLWAIPTVQLAQVVLYKKILDTHHKKHHTGDHHIEEHASA